MTDLTETVQTPPEPASPNLPEPKARKQRWSAFEGEIARTIILPKLRDVWAREEPSTIESFFESYRDTHEPDCTLSSFTEYLRILNIRTRRITVFEGFEAYAPARPVGRAVAPPPPAMIPNAAMVPPSDDGDDGSFDNETPTSNSPDITDIIEGDAARDMLRSLGFQDV